MLEMCPTSQWKVCGYVQAPQLLALATVRLRSVLAMTDLGLELITGEEDLDRLVRWAVTTDLSDPSRYLSGDELVITGMHWRRDDSDSDTFVRALAGAGAAGLIVGQARYGWIPDDVVEACRRHRIPLLRVPETVTFATVTEGVNRSLSTGRSADLGAVLDRHRQVVTGGGLDSILGLIERDLGIRCRITSFTGRVLAGQPFPPGHEIGAALGVRLPPFVVRDHGAPYSVLAVHEDSAARPINRYLVCAGDYTDWPMERRTVLRELAAIAALEHIRDGRPTVQDRIAQELIEMIVREAEPAEIVSRLEFIGTVSGRQYVVVAAAAAELRAAELREVVREILHDRIPAIGMLDGVGIALIAAENDVPLAIRRAVESPAVSRHGGGLAVGVSRAVERAGLRGAVEEARLACRTAAAGAGPARVVSHDELATHVLLLSSVPDEVRRMFRHRLLTPLHAYDRRHRTDLTHTLETFLRVSGAWTTCAELLHIHVNTLRYRIQRIEELTGRDLARLEDRVDFFLALTLW